MTGVHTMKDELCKYITDYVHQWQHEKIGNATIAELAVMACVLSDGPLSIPEAMSWMGRHSHKSFDTPNNTSSGRSDQRRLSWSSCNSDVSHVAVDGFVDEPVLKTIDRPEKLSEKLFHSRDEIDDSLTDFSVPIHEFDQLGSKHWTSPISSANVFLRRRLFACTIGTPSSCFRIMDLPVEVRELIFDFALLLPRSGVWYDFQTWHKGSGEQCHKLRAWTRDRDFALSQYLPNTWNTDRDSPSARPKALFRVDLKSHLSLLRVSKQVHKEAFACYYSRNVFYIPNDYTFLKLFRNLTDTQFRYLTHIIWRWTRTAPPSERHVQQFAALPRLRTLVIDTMEQEAGQVNVLSDFVWYTDWSSSDVSHLAAITGLQDVVFFGPIARHEHFLRSQMVGRKS